MKKFIALLMAVVMVMGLLAGCGGAAKEEKADKVKVAATTAVDAVKAEVIALTEKEAKLPKTTACIRCGACTNACPFGLNPAEILLAYKKKDAEALRRLSVDTCMLCGCCSFICPANRPLVQTNTLSKQLLRDEKAKESSKNGEFTDPFGVPPYPQRKIHVRHHARRSYRTSSYHDSGHRYLRTALSACSSSMRRFMRASRSTFQPYHKERPDGR